MSAPSHRLRRRLAVVGVALAIFAVTACEPPAGPKYLRSGEVIESGGSMVAGNGSVVLTMEANGELIHRVNGTIVWFTGTGGNPGARLVMRSQGNLAVVSTRGTILWNSPTYTSGAFTDLGDDGNLVVRGRDWQPLWANGVATFDGWRIPASQRKVSSQQVTLTKLFEGYTSGTPYNDVNQNCTVGYGHLIHMGPCTAADRAKTWNADALFDADVTEHERRLKSNLGHVPVSQREYDALWDFVFNRGSLTAKTLPQAYAALTANPPRYGEVVTALRNNGNGLIKGLCNRRYDEAQTFAGGDYARNYVC